MGDLLDVVHHREELPLGVHLSPATQGEAPHALVLEVREDGLHGAHSAAVDFSTSRGVKLPLRRIDAIRNEQALTTDRAIIESRRLQVETLLLQLRAICKGIALFDDETARLCPELPDYNLFRQLPGAGPALAPRLLAAFGERRERFPDAASLQMYAGIAPVTERSGNKSWVHWRWSCPSFLRQTFVEWVPQTINRSFWAKAHYDSCRARGIRHQAALRSLAFKWIRILHRCWLNRVPYDESRYLLALQKRNAPLLKFAAQANGRD